VTIVNIQKAVLLGLGLVAVVILGIAGVLGSEAVAAAVMTILGYIAGNTVGAKQGNAPITPVVGKRIGDEQ